MGVARQFWRVKCGDAVQVGAARERVRYLSLNTGLCCASLLCCVLCTVCASVLCVVYCVCVCVVYCVLCVRLVGAAREGDTNTTRTLTTHTHQHQEHTTTSGVIPWS